MIASFRPRLLPTLFTLPIVLLCLGLGVWQIQRLHWKEGLIAERRAGAAAAPVPLPRARAARGMEYRRVVAAGVFLNGKEIFVYTPQHAGVVGFDVLTPLREASGRIVFVNRGFIPARLRNPTNRASGEPRGTVRVEGLLRLPPRAKPDWFLPNNDPRRDRWFWVDLPAMAKADRLGRVAPFYIDADATPNPGGWPQGGLTRVTLPNHHLQYAVTWFSLAIALSVIYVLYHRGARPRS